MKTVTIRCAALVGALSAAAPAAAMAHQGHAGDHGWLQGALQPLLSVDHLLAGLVVMALLSAGLTALVRGRRAASARED
jgi:hydrogenase/urease accessory protein HupE